MTKIPRLVVTLGALTLLAGTVTAQTPSAAAPAAPASPATDIYRVMFVKAAPGQAAALATQLQQPDPKDPMSAHFLLLRHQEGADWDYCFIQHAGPKATVEITPQPAGGPAPTMAWHEDTFVSGPSWAEFQRAMGMTAGGTPIYIVGVHRAVPGHRADLLRELGRRAPGAQGASNDLLFTHVDGASWQYLTISRFGSWQELATEEAAAGSGDRWTELRKHSAFHGDTIADRVK